MIKYWPILLPLVLLGLATFGVIILMLARNAAGVP